MASRPFSATPDKAWDRLVELVVYDPTEVDAQTVLENGGKQFGLVISDLHVTFEVTESQVYAENTAEFKVYNASEATRRLLSVPGKRVRFSAGYTHQGGVQGLFWGSILRAPSKKEGNDWVTTLTCISSLTEATSTLALTAAGKVTNNQTLGTSKLTPAQRQNLINQAVNRIPIQASYGPDVAVKSILADLGTMTGLVVWGAEGMGPITLDNGWVYVGGIRGALQNLRQILRRWGWNLYMDSTTILVTPMDGFGASTYSVAYLSYETGLLSLRETTPLNIPPKTDRNGNRIPVPPTYEFKAMLSPKIRPNQQVLFKVPHLNALALVEQVKFHGDSFGGDFAVEGKCVVWSGPGDTYRKSSG